MLASFVSCAALSCGDDAGSSDNQAAAYKTIIVPNMSTDVEISKTGTAKLSVIALSASGTSAGLGLVGETIQWGIEKDNASIALSETSVKTTYGGIAAAEVRGTGVAGNFTVIASSPGAPNKISFNIRIAETKTETQSGNLRVKTVYNDVAEIANYSIHIYNSSDFDCDAYNPDNGIEAADVLPKVDAQTAEFADLTPNKSYTVVANGYNASGARVASGCVDYGTTVYNKQWTEATVYLNMFDLNFNTTYHVRSYFDWGDIASGLGTVGKFVSYIGDFGNNPSQAVYDLVIKTLKSSLGKIAAGGLDAVLKASGIKDHLLLQLNSYLVDNATACRVGNFACQLRSILRSMEFMGEINIQKAGKVELKGNNSYDGMAMYWRDGCKTDKDGYYIDPSCGRMALTTKDLETEKQISFLEGSWTGSLANGYDKVSIEAHDLELEYGKIATYAIYFVILPKLANGATTFEEAIAHWMSCPLIAAYLKNSLDKTCVGVRVSGSCIGVELSVTNEQALEWCNAAAKGVTEMLDFASASITLKNAKARISVSGTAKLRDTNADNMSDDIVDGKWSGSMTITTMDESHNTKTATTAVDGMWTAYNAKNVKIGEGDAIYCTNKKVSGDASDLLCAYPPVDMKSVFSSSNVCEHYIKCIEAAEKNE